MERHGTTTGYLLNNTATGEYLRNFQIMIELRNRVLKNFLKMILVSPGTAIRQRTEELFRELKGPLDTSTESSGPVARRTRSQADLSNVNLFKLN